MYLCKRAKWIYQHTRLLYWAIVAITTVDISPVRPLGKFVASVFMLMGYGIIATEMAQALKPKREKHETCPSCGREGHDHDAACC